MRRVRQSHFDGNAGTKVLIATGFYTPAFRGGGPIQTLNALVAAAPAEYAVNVICANRDLGESSPLVDRPNEWLRVDRARVRYVEGGLGALRAAYRSAADAELVYLNSLFNYRYSILPMVLRRLGRWRGATLLLAPRGELNPGALALKSRKKRLFIRLFRMLRLASLVIWHASTDEEESRIRAVFGDRTRVVVRENETTLPCEAYSRPPRAEGGLRLLFASRLHAHKGLVTLLEALADMTEPVRLEVVGAFESGEYEALCREAVQRLPSQVSVDFWGALPRQEVLLRMREADLMALPTAGENFGHVIAEALSESCPVLCSTHTPWTELLLSGGGAVVSPDTTEAWTAALQDIHEHGPEAWQNSSERAGQAYNVWRRQAKGPHVFELAGKQRDNY